MSLRWLHIKFRIQCKIFATMFKASHVQTADYIIIHCRLIIQTGVWGPLIRVDLFFAPDIRQKETLSNSLCLWTFDTICFWFLLHFCFGRLFAFNAFNHLCFFYFSVKHFSRLRVRVKNTSKLRVRHITSTVPSERCGRFRRWFYITFIFWW